MSKKRKIFLIFLLTFFIFCTLPCHAKVVDKILVIVDDEIITQGEVDRILLPIYAQYKSLYRGQELDGKFEEARKGILQRLIHDKLLLCEARRKKIEVDAKEVEAKIDEARRRFPTESDFKLALRQENILLQELEKRYRERLMVDRLIDMEVKKRVSIAPIEVRAYYEEHKELFKEPRKAKVRSILIRVNEERDEDQALRLARVIVNRLRQGGDFAHLAEKYSEGPYAKYGGDMGWVEEGEMMGRINDLVFSLDKGDISGILKTNLGYHTFKVEEKMDEKSVKFFQARRQVEQALFNEKLAKKLDEWITELKKNAYIAFR